MTEFQNPSDDATRELLKNTRRIAVVGMSAKPDRPSHGVSAALIRLNFEVVAVRPGVDEVMGRPAVPDLRSLDAPVDLVVVFRRPEFVDEIVDACIEQKLPALWLQDGVVNETAAMRAREAGMTVVMDRCIYRDGIPLIQEG